MKLSFHGSYTKRTHAAVWRRRSYEVWNKLPAATWEADARLNCPLKTQSTVTILQTIALQCSFILFFYFVHLLKCFLFSTHFTWFHIPKRTRRTRPRKMQRGCPCASLFSLSLMSQVALLRHPCKHLFWLFIFFLSANLDMREVRNECGPRDGNIRGGDKVSMVSVWIDQRRAGCMLHHGHRICISRRAPHDVDGAWVDLQEGPGQQGGEAV